MRKRIILVEDHEDLREVTAEWLAMAGFDVAAFGTAEDALVALETRLPHALLTDLTLPGMDGAELAGRARLFCAGRPLLIVALTGSRDVALATAFDAVECKPVDMDRVTALLGGA